MEDKYCFYSKSEFERFRYDLDKEENSRCQNLISLAWASVIPGDHFYVIYFKGVKEGCNGRS